MPRIRGLERDETFDFLHRNHFLFLIISIHNCSLTGLGKMRQNKQNIEPAYNLPLENLNFPDRIPAGSFDRLPEQRTMGRWNDCRSGQPITPLSAAGRRSISDNRRYILYLRRVQTWRWKSVGMPARVKGYNSQEKNPGPRGGKFFLGPCRSNWSAILLTTHIPTSKLQLWGYSFLNIGAGALASYPISFYSVLECGHLL